MAGTPQKKKVVILGGGVGALAAAFGITECPNWQDHFEITVYQIGWRLGGKGASGRNASRQQRIEEHGLHVWGGYYENGFRVMQKCYALLNRPPTAPLATWDKAFLPHSLVTWQEFVDGAWIPWNIWFPTNNLVPGDGKVFTLWEYLKQAIELLFSFVNSSPHAASNVAGTLRVPSADNGTRSVPPTLSPADAPGLWTRFAPGWLQDFTARAENRIAALLEALPRPSLGQPAAQLLHAALTLVHEAPDDPAEHEAARHQGILWLLDQGRTHLRDSIRERVAGDNEARRFWLLTELGFAMTRGVIADGVLTHGLESIDRFEFSEWLRRHGASEETIASAPLRAVYDYIFAFRQGVADMEHRDLAAGVGVGMMARLAFGYKGALFWKMQAGMGDTVFTPLYQALKQRGVNFQFFSRIQKLELSADKTAVERIRLAQQVTLKHGSYDPLVNVADLACWPSTPVYDQIKDQQAAQLQARGINLESPWSYSQWQDPAEVVLDRGNHDFDIVVLGISLGALSLYCEDLMLASQPFRDMVHQVDTVQTLGVQLWMKPNLVGLGWPVLANLEPGVAGTIMTSNAEPLDTWADMSQLLVREEWPANDLPRNLAYFCGPLAESTPPPPFSDHEFPKRQHDQLRQTTLNWLNTFVGFIWPDAVGPEIGQQVFNWNLLVDPENQTGVKRLDSQFWIADVSPSDRYVMSTVKGTQARLPADQSGFANLYLAGDWVKTSYNFGCVEAATIAGLQAARAISGYPKEIPGEQPL